MRSRGKVIGSNFLKNISLTMTTPILLLYQYMLAYDDALVCNEQAGFVGLLKSYYDIHTWT